MRFIPFFAARRLLKSNVPRQPELKCDVRASFATAFKSWRRKSGIPLKRIAADLGLSNATINKWERGERFPTKRHFELPVECLVRCLKSRRPPQRFPAPRFLL